MALSLQQEQQSQDLQWEQLPEGISDLELAKKLQEEEDRRASQYYQEQEQEQAAAAAAQAQVGEREGQARVVEGLPSCLYRSFFLFLEKCSGCSAPLTCTSNPGSMNRAIRRAYLLT